MWVIPLVSGNGQEPAVNIATARHLSIGKAAFGTDSDRLAIYAVFAEGEDQPSRIPLLEILITDDDLSSAREDARKAVGQLLEATRQGVLVFDWV